MSKYSKKDYNMVAKILRTVSRNSFDEYQIVLAIKKEFISLFERDNPLFDVDKFNEACKIYYDGE